MIRATPPNLIATLKGFAERKPCEEIARQFSVMDRMETDRRLLTLVEFAVSALFLPIWVSAALFLLDIGFEVVGFRLLRNLAPERQPVRYGLMLASYGMSQAVYCLVPVLCWQLEDPFAKSFAVGATLISLIHIATVRTVHLPLGLVGGIVITAASTLGNGWYWVAIGNLTGLAISTGCIAAAAYFALITILSVHRLHGDMLRESKAAQAADQAKSRFLAQMSHELRTPLNAILGMGRAELTLAEHEGSRERLSILVQSAQGLSVMLDDILDLSAVQAGQLPIHPRALDLRAEIASTVAMFRQQVEDAGLVLRFSIHDSVPHQAVLDGQRLRQCLSNILSNAVKYTQSGLISVYSYEHQPGMLAIKVADSGPGVPDNLRERIFEPFYRGQLNVPGTGLGMSIARTLARRMGGDLTLLPSVSGAHFLLTLRIEPASPADLPAPERLAGSSLAGIVVLVVDDIATNRLVAATYLRLLGAIPVEVASGAEALARLAGPALPDLILLDLLMPGMDGRETLRRIRNLGGTASSLPVVAMSADSSAQLRPGSGDPHFDGAISKPISGERLAKVLMPLVGRNAAADKDSVPL